MTPHPDRVAGSLLGLALGDALGFVVEAEPPDAAAAYVADWVRCGRAAERCHAVFPFGQYSDDTQLARELLASLVEAGGWRPQAFAARIAELFRRGSDVGAGPGTRGAALRLAAGIPWDRAATPPPYAGNGSAMRVGPLGPLLAGRPALLCRIAAEQGRLTHLDARCSAGAVAVAAAASLAASPGPLDRRAFLQELAHFVEAEDASVASAIAAMESWAGLEPDAAAERLYALRLDPSPSGRHRGFTPFVTPSVLWSLYAFLRSPDDYLETVCTAIGAGGDTDTMAAMAGAVAGAHLGTGALPPELIGRLNDRGGWRGAELEALARRCAAIALTD